VVPADLGSSETGLERIIALRERWRIAEILHIGEAIDRIPTARHLAFKTDVSVEVALGILRTVLTNAEVLRQRAIAEGANRLRVVA
jgi:hypothetical protein